LSDSSEIDHNRFNVDREGKDIYIQDDFDILVTKNCFYGDEIKSEVEDGDSDSKGFYQNYYAREDDNNSSAIQAGK